MKKYLIIFILIYSCSMENNTIETISVKGETLSNEDLESIIDKETKEGNNITVSFINNPMRLNNSDKIILYCNKEIIYFGEFKGYFNSKISNNLKDNEIAHFKLIILKQINSNETSQYIMQNKSVCYWCKYP